VGFDLCKSSVEGKVDAAWGTDSELSVWDEEFSKTVAEGRHDDCANDSSKGKADANGAEFCEIVGVLVQGEEELRGKDSLDWRGEVIAKNDPDKLLECVEVGASGFVGRTIFGSEAVRLEDVSAGGQGT